MKKGTIKLLKKVTITFFTLAILSSSNVNAQLYINEIFATNASADLDLVSYNYFNWLEIYNSGNSKVTLSGYYLSDDSLNLKKWNFPADSIIGSKSFFTVFTEGYEINVNDDHANFKLSSDGGILILSNSLGEIIDKVTYNKQYFNVPFGRKPDGDNSWNYFASPTRGKTNGSSILTGVSGDIIFYTKGGYYNETISLELASSNNSGAIYYTTDASNPDSNSTKYTKAISISSTKVIRARVVEPGKIPGNIFTQTYFINERKPKLPTLSLVTEQKNLDDDMIGIYVEGKNGKTGFCATGPVNWNQDWERCTNFELYDVAQTQVLNQITGTKLGGACSRTNPQKSMIVSAKSKYGKGKFKYKFYRNKPFDDFDDVYLRDSGNDFWFTMFRDAMIQTITVGRMGLDYQACEPVSFYLNGQYWGLINNRERSGTSLIKSNYGLDDDNIDFLELNASVVSGSADGYLAMIDYIKNNNMADPAVYKNVGSQMDIDNYINYEITEIYINNGDWPGNNCKYWRSKKSVSKWKWILYDTDFGFGLYNSGPETNTLTFALDSTHTDPYYWPNPSWGTFLLRSLLKNPGFKNKFINKFYAHINTTFAPNRVIHIIDSMKNNIADEIPYHYKKWGEDINSWEPNIQVMRDFATKRPDYMRGFLKNYFNLDTNVNVTCHFKNNNSGTIQIDGVSSTDSVFNGVFPINTICNVGFIGRDGYKFVKAERIIDSKKLIKLIKSGDEWKYFDKGIDLGTTWVSPDFEDSTWASGKSELGYGDGGEATVVSYGPDPNNKYVTTYFRKTINYDTAQHFNNATLRLIYDDGCILYLNGKELLRVNLPSTKVGFDTFASLATVENVFFDYPFNVSLLKNGNNVFAVEMHQANKTSSDISFDLELNGFSSDTISHKIIYSNNFNDTLNGNIGYVAYFEPVKTVANLVINEIDPSNTSFADETGNFGDWIEVYNNNSDSIDMAGLFFSSSTNFSNAWEIPFGYRDQTIIAPEEYKIFWADTRINSGAIHLSFKLSKDGQDIILFQIVGNDTTVLDKIKYNVFSGHHTIGRIPNISGSFKELATGTPGSANIDNPEEVQKLDFNIKNISILYNYKNKIITILPDAEYIGKSGYLSLSDISGKVLLNEKINFFGTKIIDLSPEKTGMYIIHLICENKIFSKKIIIQ